MLALMAAPSLLIVRRTQSLERFEVLVVVVVGSQVHPKVESGGTQPSHQGRNGRLSPAGLVGGNRWLGDAQAIGKFSLREAALEPSGENEAACDARTALKPRNHVR